MHGISSADKAARRIAHQQARQFQADSAAKQRADAAELAEIRSRISVALRLLEQKAAAEIVPVRSSGLFRTKMLAAWKIGTFEEWFRDETFEADAGESPFQCPQRFHPGVAVGLAPKVVGAADTVEPDLGDGDAMQGSVESTKMDLAAEADI